MGVQLLTMLILHMLIVQYATIQALNNVNYLQNLIDSAPPFSELVIPPGIYHGPIHIHKPLTLKGTAGSVIDGRGLADVIVIETNNVVLEGFTVFNSFSDVAFEPAGIKIVDSSNIVLRGNKVKQVVHAVYVVNSSKVVIEDNELTSISEKAVNDRGHGVYLWYSREVVVVGNRISNVKDGIYSDHSLDIIIKLNEVSGSRYGIHLMYSRDHLLDGNNIHHNLVGMALMYSCILKISNNSIWLNRGLVVSEGVFVRESCETDIEGNRIYGNAVGINIVNSPYPPTRPLVIARNIIAFNNVGINFEIWSSSIFVENDMVENAQQLSSVATTLNNSWRGNFWSDRGIQLGDRYLVISPLEDLMDKKPILRTFNYGPGYIVLKNLRVLQGVQPNVKAVDTDPSNSPNLLRFVVTERSHRWLLVAALLSFLPFLLIFQARRKWVS